MQVIALFRRKITSGHFTEALMADAIHGRARALNSLLKNSLMGITDALVSLLGRGGTPMPEGWSDRMNRGGPTTAASVHLEGRDGRAFASR